MDLTNLTTYQTRRPGASRSKPTSSIPIPYKKSETGGSHSTKTGLSRSAPETRKEIAEILRDDLRVGPTSAPPSPAGFMGRRYTRPKYSVATVSYHQSPMQQAGCTKKPPPIDLEIDLPEKNETEEDIRRKSMMLDQWRNYRISLETETKKSEVVTLEKKVPN